MKKNYYWLITISIILVYLVTHIYQLTLLPVFADEAIYIRWTQLIIDDWQQYLFFPMNDGKTPLVMWLMVPFQFIFSNQLFAGRIVSVLVGLGQILSLGYLAKVLTQKKEAVWAAMILSSILPFWFFHHRMALTDAMLCLGITLSMIGVVQIIKTKKNKLWIGLTALFVGLALWAKLPAVLILPSLFLYACLEPNKNNQKLKYLGQIGLGVSGGALLFLVLKLHPVFPQLFSRGNDFLYPWQEVIIQGKWQDTLINIPTYFGYFIKYLTWPVLILNLIGQFLPSSKQRRIQHLLLLSTIVFVGPIAILGKVVYPRYLFPASIFITTSAAITLAELFRLKSKQKNITSKIIFTITLIGMISITLYNSGKYIYYSLTNASQTPFVSADKEQYLYKWSSGHGIKETVSLINDLSQDKKVAVATEGSFGTLPDGLLMYFHRQNVDNIYVEGIGFPVKNITPKFSKRAQEFDQVLLVVNSHRLEIELQPEQLITQFCRPNNAPCLQIWDITHLIF